MKTFLYSLFLVILFSSCNRKLAVLDIDQLASSEQEKQIDAMDFELSMVHQTKKTIAFEVVISNTSNQPIVIDPIDFFYTPEDFTYSVNPYDPEYLRFQVEHPLQAISNNAYQDYENGNVFFELATNVVLESDFGYISMSGIKFLKYLAEIRDFRKIKLDEILEKQTLKSGDRLRGLVYFPKKEFKKKESVYINWERENEILNRKFLVDRWRK